MISDSARMKNNWTYALTDGRLVNLDGTDAGLLEVDDFVTEGESELLGLQLTADIGAREGPVENGDGTSQHSLHGLLGDALRVAAPADGHRSRAADIRDDNGGTNITEHSDQLKVQVSRERSDSPRTVALHPRVLREDEAVELLTEVLNHVVTLGFTVDEEV